MKRYPRLLIFLKHDKQDKSKCNAFSEQWEADIIEVGNTDKEIVVTIIAHGNLGKEGKEVSCWDVCVFCLFTCVWKQNQNVWRKTRERERERLIMRWNCHITSHDSWGGHKNDVWGERIHIFVLSHAIQCLVISRKKIKRIKMQVREGGIVFTSTECLETRNLKGCIYIYTHTHGYGGLKLILSIVITSIRWYQKQMHYCQ